MQSETQLRRRARAEGLTLIKYRPNSRWYAQYGPYALADENNNLIAWGMERAVVEREVSST
jgi:hypothetical protein